MTGLRTTLERAREHPALTAFAVALLMRALVAVAATALSLEIPDEGTFWDLAGAVLQDGVGEMDSRDRAVYEEAKVYVMLLAGVRWIGGGSLLAGRLVAAVAGAATAAFGAIGARRLGRSRDVGLAAGLLIALWPSQVGYSSFIKKDSLTWMVLAAGFAAITVWLDEDDPSAWWSLAAFAAVVGSGAALMGIRPSTGLIFVIAAAGAAILAALARRHLHRSAMAAGLVVAVALVPALTGYGTAGSDFLARAENSVVIRSHEAQDGCTTFVDTPPSELSLETFVRRAPRGLSATWLEPHPWQDVCSVAGEAAKVEAAATWLLLGLAAVSVVRMRSRWGLLAFPLLLVGGLTVAGAVAESNAGTAFRHRGAMLWAVLVLASPYVVHLVSRARWTLRPGRGG